MNKYSFSLFVGYIYILNIFIFLLSFLGFFRLGFRAEGLLVVLIIYRFWYRCIWFRQDRNILVQRELLVLLEFYFFGYIELISFKKIIQGFFSFIRKVLLKIFFMFFLVFLGLDLKILGLFIDIRKVLYCIQICLTREVFFVFGGFLSKIFLGSFRILFGLDFLVKDIERNFFNFFIILFNFFRGIV